MVHIHDVKVQFLQVSSQTFISIDIISHTYIYLTFNDMTCCTDLLVEIKEKEKNLSLIPCILEGQSIISTNQSILTANQSILSNIIIQLTKPHAPSSNKSEREFHQQNMKNEVIERYQLANPSDPSQIKCMVMDRYFRRDEVHCSHIIGLRLRHSLAVVVGLKDEDIWSPLNGLGLFKEIEKVYHDLEAVSHINSFHTINNHIS